MDDLKRWRDALIADREDRLIRAARRWFGPVRTPFNKHELLAKVEAYLRKPSTQESILELMDGADRAAVAGVILAGSLHQAEVERLINSVTGESPTRRMDNLLERMILYRHDGKGRYAHISLAPPLAALEKKLGWAQLVARAEFRKDDAAAGTEPWAVFCALMSAAMHARPAFKLNYEYTKKASAQLEKTAPEILSGAYASSFFLLSLMGARALLPSESGRLVADPKRFLELSAYLERRYGDAAALALAASHPELQDSWFDVDTRVAFLRWLLSELPTGLCMDIPAMEALIGVMASVYLRALAASGDEDALDTLDHDQGGHGRSLASFSVLSELGFIRITDDRKLLVTAQGRALFERGKGGGPALVLEESHELRVLPEAGPSARAFAAVSARLESTGLIWSAVLDREAAQSTYAHGLSSAELSERLKAMTGKDLSQSVAFSLKEWEKRSKGARLVQGLVATLDEHNAALVDHLPHMADLVREKLAPGVYLLKPASLKDVEKAFKAAGVKLDVPEIADGERMSSIPDAWSGFSQDDKRPVPEPLSGLPPAIGQSLAALAGSQAPGGAEGAARVHKLLYELQGMDLTDQVRESLADTVRSRLILDASQLAKADVTAESSSAGALDYPGKVRLLERAIREGQSVELVAGGERSVLKGEALGLRKTPEGMEFTLLTNRGKTVILLVSAIERLRIAHSDMFGGS